MDVWPFIPQHGLTESLEWLTDVIRCKAGEQRQSLRTLPRHTYLFSYLMNPDEFSRAKSFARARLADEVLLPLWSEATLKGAITAGATSVAIDTRFAHYAAGGQFVVWQSDGVFEVRTALTVTTGLLTFTDPLVNDYTSALVVPARVVAFAQSLDASRGANLYANVSARFIATQSTDLSGSAAARPLYRSHDVLMDRTAMQGSVREKFEREVTVIDNGTGLMWRDPKYTYPIQTTSVGWDAASREQLWGLRAWLYTRRGKCRGFWVPSWNADLELVKPIASTNTYITVKAVGYPSFEGVRDVMILTKSGTAYYRRILSGLAGLPGEEVLNLETTAGFNLAVADVDMICFLSFMRLDTDRVEIKHREANAASISATVMEAPVP